MPQAKRGRRSNELKFKVALEAIREEKTIAKIAETYGVHPNQVSEWKKQLLENGANISGGPVEKEEAQLKKQQERMFKTIGQQQLKIDWFKKKLGVTDVELGEP